MQKDGVIETSTVLIVANNSTNSGDCHACGSWGVEIG